MAAARARCRTSTLGMWRPSTGAAGSARACSRRDGGGRTPRAMRSSAVLFLLEPVVDLDVLGLQLELRLLRLLLEQDREVAVRVAGLDGLVDEVARNLRDGQRH